MITIVVVREEAKARVEAKEKVCFDRSKLNYITITLSNQSHFRLYHLLLPSLFHRYHNILGKGQGYYYSSGKGKGKGGPTPTVSNSHTHKQTNTSSFFTCLVCDSFSNIILTYLYYHFSFASRILILLLLAQRKPNPKPTRKPTSHNCGDAKLWRFKGAHWMDCQYVKDHHHCDEHDNGYQIGREYCPKSCGYCGNSKPERRPTKRPVHHPTPKPFRKPTRRPTRKVSVIILFDRL